MNIEHSTVRKGVNCNQEIQGTVKASPLTERIESQDTGINPFANKSGEEIFAYNQFLNKILSHIDGCVYLPAIDGFPGFKNQKYTPSSTIKNSKTVERTDEGKPEIALKKAEARLADPGSKLSAIINKLSSEKIREILEQSFTGKSKEDLDTLARTISEGKLPLPDKVKFVSRQELKGHNAAYFYGGHREKQALTKGLINKPGTVLLADDLCGDELIAAYTEEVGHHFDHILGGDSRGDEGQIFYESIDAALKGKALDEARIGSLREEDDRGHISIDGQDMEVEHQQEQRSREELDAYIWWHEKGPYMNHEIAMRVLSGKDNTISDEAVPHIARRLSHRPEFKDLVEQFNIRHATAHKGAREFHSYLLGSGSLSKATEHLGNRHYYSPYMEREHYRAFAGTLSNLPGLDQEILGRLEHFLDGKDPITGYRRRDSRWAKPVAEREKILKAIHSHNPSALRDALEGDNSNLHQEAARYILKGAGDVPEKKTFDLLDKVNDRYGVSYANHLVAEKYLSTLPAAHEFDASAYRSYFEQKDHTGNPRYASHDARPAMDRVRLLNMMKQGNSKGFAQALGNSDENLVSRALERVKLDFTHNPAAAVNLLNELNPQQRADILADVIARTDNDDAGAIAADSLLAETDIGFKALGNRFKKSADSDEIQRQRLGALAGRREVIESALNGSIENSAFIEQSMLEGYISPSSDLARAAAGGDLTQLKSLAQTDNTVGRAAVEALGEEGEAIIDELVHRNDGIGVAAMKALAGQGKFNQIARHAEREDPAGLEAVKQLTQQGGAHLEGLVSRLSVIPAKSREVIQNALEEQLKKEKGFSLIITALPNTSKGFRSRLYDHANNTIVEKRGWQNKYGKRSGTKTPEHSFYEKVVAHALNDMGTEDLPGYSDNEADKLGRRARNLLDTAPRFDIYPGGKMENLHQALLEHQRKGNYCGEKKYGSRLDKLRHRLENYNRYRGPGFEEDLRKMGLNEDSFELLEDRITFFDEARPELYSRLKQLETRARAEGNEQALKRLDQIFEALAEKESCNTPYREQNSDRRLNFECVENAFVSLQEKGNLKNLEGLTNDEWRYAAGRLQGSEQTMDGIFKALHKEEPKRYRDTINALNRTKAPLVKEVVSSELRRISNDPFDELFEHPELKETIESNQVLPHPARLAVTWGLEGNDDEIMSQAVSAVENYGDEAVRRLKTRAESWNSLSQQNRCHLLFGLDDLDSLSAAQNRRLEQNLDVGKALTAMAGGVLVEDDAALLTGQHPLEKRISSTLSYFEEKRRIEAIPASFEHQDATEVPLIANANIYSGPNEITCIDLEQGSAFPIGPDSLKSKKTLNTSAFIAEKFSAELAGIRVSSIESLDSGQVTLKDGSSVPYTLYRYGIDQNGTAGKYDVLLAESKTGDNFLTRVTRWIVVVNEAGEFNLKHARDFAKKCHPKNGYSPH